MSDTLARLQDVFRDVFDDDEIVLDRGTMAGDIEGWDSLMHVTLVVNAEKVFGVKFRSGEVAALKDVGEMVDLIDARRSGS
jgi:acyl carrier protein